MLRTIERHKERVIEWAIRPKTLWKPLEELPVLAVEPEGFATD
jgi:hypothetical protein